MDSRLELTSDVRAYAELSVILAEPDADRVALLAERGLDEDAWDEIDDLWQTRLSEAIEVLGEVDTVPPLVQEHAEAFAKVQAARVATGAPLSFERFIEVTRELQRGHDIQHVLKRNGTTLHDYLRAEQHWLKQMMNDPALQARFHQAMQRRG